MSKIKVTIEGDMKFAGYIRALLQNSVDQKRHP